MTTDPLYVRRKSIGCSRLTQATRITIEKNTENHKLENLKEMRLATEISHGELNERTNAATAASVAYETRLGKSLRIFVRAANLWKLCTKTNRTSREETEEDGVDRSSVDHSPETALKLRVAISWTSALRVCLLNLAGLCCSYSVCMKCISTYRNRD